LLFQYQELAKPLIEQVTVDKWFQPASVPVLPKAQPRFLYFVEPRLTSFGEVILVDKWFQPLQVPMLPRQQARIGQFTSTLEPSLILQPPALSWFQPLQVPPNKKPRDTESLGGDVAPLEPSLIIEPALESWHRPTGTPPDKAKRNPEGIFSYPLEPSLFVVPDLESWHRPTNTPQINARRSPLGWVADVAAWTPDTLTLDKWEPILGMAWPKSRVAHTLFVTVLEPEFIEPPSQSWMRPTEIPPAKPRRGPEGWTADVAAWTPDTLTLDKWGPVLGQAWPKQRVAHTWFVTTLEPQHIEPPLNSWHRPTEVPPSKSRRHPEGWIADVAAWTPGTLTMDWFVELGAPIRLVNLLAQDVSLVIIEADLSWMMEFPVPVVSRSVVSTQSQFVFLESSIMDWLMESCSPLSVRRSNEGYFAFQFQEVPVSFDWWMPVDQPPLTTKKLTGFESFIFNFVPTVPTPVPCPYRPESSDQTATTDLANDFSFAYIENVDHNTIVAASSDETGTSVARNDETVTYAGGIDDDSQWFINVGQADVQPMRGDESDGTVSSSDTTDAKRERGDDSDGREASSEEDDEQRKRRDECSS